MKLDNKLNLKNKNIIFIGVIVAIIVIISLIFLFNQKQAPIDVSPTPAPTLDVEDLPLETREPEIAQNDTINVMKGIVTNIRDVSTKYEITVLIGVDDNAKETIVTANLNTVFYNFDKKMVVLPSDLAVGNNVVLYGTGNYNVENVVANVIGVGDNTSYRYGYIKNITGNLESGYTWEISDTFDTLNVPINCDVINGYTGESIANMGLVTKESKILYRYLPDFDITEKGNIYTCSEIVILSLGETVEE